MVLENCVLMEAVEAERHEQEVGAEGRVARDVWGVEVEGIVKERAREVRRWREWVGP